MTARFVAYAAALLAVATASAQKPDTSSNSSLSGDYFIREVQMTGTTAGAVTAASSVIGTATFDGKGGYTFKGQGYSLASGLNSALSLTGTYGVGSTGFLRIQSFAAPTDFDFGGVSAVGPQAFVASATEGTNVTTLIGIQAGATVTNASFKGAYTAAAIDFPGATNASVRQATFNLTADGAGGLGNVAISGIGSSLGGTVLSQTASGVTYSLSGEGSGTITFGTASASQLVSGAKTFFISADGNLVLGGAPGGFDILVGLRSLSGAGSNSTANGLYYMAALEDQLDLTGKTPNVVDAFYGSANSTGSGLTIFHNRTQSLIYNVFDFTYDTNYTIGSDGTIPLGGSTPYQFAYGAGGKAFIATGNAAGSPPLYSLTLGLAVPAAGTVSGVFLNPTGIVNSANFAPITNPVAPNEFVTLFGTGLAGTATSAPSLPLPTTLGGVQVTFNGIQAPLDFVSPTQIICLVPSSISPRNGVPYVTVQVTNNNVASNQVTVYTSNSSPGVFAFNPAAVGGAAAEHGNNSSVISGANPAAVGETVTLFLAGLGSVSPAVVPDGGPAISAPFNLVTDPNVNVDFSGVAAAQPLPFVGLTPTAAGLYQINVAIPSGVGSNVFVDVGTADGYTSEATMATTTTAAAHEREQALSKALEVKRHGTIPGRAKTGGFSSRTQ